jgi:hypothetical protein
MRKALLLGGVVVLLFVAVLTACSDGLSAVDDDPLADRDDYYVHGITYQMDPLYPPIPHEANVGLRHVYTSPFTTYISMTESDEETGYYEFLLNELDEGWYACDAWAIIGTELWRGSSSNFHWDSEKPDDFIRDIYMYEQ